MAAPTTPGSPFAGIGFWQLAIDIITICSNLALPSPGDATVTTAISGATATAIVAILTTQKNLT